MPKLVCCCICMLKWKLRGEKRVCLLRESRVCLTSLLVPCLCELWSGVQVSSALNRWWWCLALTCRYLSWAKEKSVNVVFPFLRIQMLLTFIDSGIQSLLPATVKRWVTLLALQNACSSYFIFLYLTTSQRWASPALTMMQIWMWFLENYISISKICSDLHHLPFFSVLKANKSK